jgi:hypothetical protein
LLTGALRGELGLDNASSRLDSVLERWVRNINVTTALSRNGINWHNLVKIEAIQSDWIDVINLPESSIVSVSDRGYFIIPWLRWLLTEGGRTLIRDYVVDFNINATSRRFSRSGEAIMKPKPGAIYRIPSEHAGTNRDNFVLRALIDFDDKITEIITRGLS